jgi:division protein CdvB (Snf7/Vps24/ESCRT-III family)
MSSFGERWFSNKKPAFARVRNRRRPKDLLRPKIENAEKKIMLQMSKIDLALSRISDRDGYIFKRVVLSLQRKDRDRASIYANELLEVRKLEKLVTQSKLALQQISLRLNTVRDLGDALNIISPAINVVKNVGSNLSYIMPEAEGEIGEINDILGDILIEAGDLSGGGHINVGEASPEAERILEEASALAENRVKELFPEISSPSIQKTPEEIEV